MSAVICQRCGASNAPQARYCMTCGTALVPTAPPAPQPLPQPAYPYAMQPVQPYYQYQYPQNYWEVARTNKINNTLTGLLLLVIGALISWIPFAGAIGGIVGFIGAILILVGREPFGENHVRNTTLALIFFIVGITVTIFGFFYAIVYGVSTAINGGSSSSIVALFSIIFVIGGAIFGLSEVLLTYSLQKSHGRTLLWTAYAISIALGLVNLVILPFSSGGFWTLYFGTGVFLFTGFLAAIPAAIYGTAFYLASERIVRHEIPPPMTQPSTGTPPW